MPKACGNGVAVSYMDEDREGDGNGNGTAGSESRNGVGKNNDEGMEEVGERITDRYEGTWKMGWVVAVTVDRLGG